MAVCSRCRIFCSDDENYCPACGPTNHVYHYFAYEEPNIEKKDGEKAKEDKLSFDDYERMPKSGPHYQQFTAPAQIEIVRKTKDVDCVEASAPMPRDHVSIISSLTEMLVEVIMDKMSVDDAKDYFSYPNGHENPRLRAIADSLKILENHGVVPNDVKYFADVIFYSAVSRADIERRANFDIVVRNSFYQEWMDIPKYGILASE